MLLCIDKRINEILDSYVNIEIERLTTNIVNLTVNEIMSEMKYNNFLFFSKDAENKLENISYNTELINTFTDKVALKVYDELLDLEIGDIDGLEVADKFKKGKFKNIENGLICDVSLGSIKNSTLFANIGPTIPIKLTFIGQVSTNLDVKVREYGINNLMVEVYLIVNVKEQASMPLTSKKKEIVVRVPLSIEIIKGEIPKYYSGSFG